MHHEFCPDCGHILSQSWTNCMFCGWSDQVDYSAYSGFDPDSDDDMAYALADDISAENTLGL